MTSNFDIYINSILENIEPLFKKKNNDGTYSFTDKAGIPQLGGKSYNKDMADRIMDSNKLRIELANAPKEDIPEEPDIEDLPITGEYWFDGNGNAQYADGDIGDMNHEAYVIQRCGLEVASYFNLDLNDNDFSSLEDDILSDIRDEVDDSWGEIENDPADAIIKYLVNFFKIPENKASDLVLTAYGSTTDAREYAIKNWNWIRVHRTNIEVNKLNVDTLRNVAKGINDALHQEGNMYEDSAYDRAGRTSYNISTYTGKRYSITLDDMQAGNISGLEEEPNVAVSAASQQLRQMDIDAMPKYYQKKGVIGDSFNNYVHLVTRTLL